MLEIAAGADLEEAVGWARAVGTVERGRAAADEDGGRGVGQDEEVVGDGGVGGVSRCGEGGGGPEVLGLF